MRHNCLLLIALLGVPLPSYAQGFSMDLPPVIERGAIPTSGIMQVVDGLLADVSAVEGFDVVWRGYRPRNLYVEIVLYHPRTAPGFFVNAVCYQRGNIIKSVIRAAARKVLENDDLTRDLAGLVVTSGSFTETEVRMGQVLNDPYGGDIWIVGTFLRNGDVLEGRDVC